MLRDLAVASSTGKVSAHLLDITKHEALQRLVSRSR